MNTNNNNEETSHEENKTPVKFDKWHSEPGFCELCNVVGGYCGMCDGSHWTDHNTPEWHRRGKL